ncbi:MAG: alpha/beta hydrolase [Rhizobiales bacterium]|nr:alpha/beta hydrolase [Rhizobacter sp.]
MRRRDRLATGLLFAAVSAAQAQPSQKVVDLPTRAGVTQRMLVITPAEPKAAVVLIPGGHGGLQMFPNGTMKWGEGNFLVRTRQLFADQGMTVVVIDAPSDRQSPPFLQGFRQRPEHTADIKAVVAWLRESAKVPVWLVGTSRGTQSAAYAMTELAGPDAPDGVVLTATILTDDKGRPVPAMPLGKIRAPVLVVHHKQDACGHCAFADMPSLMDKLGGSARRQLLAFEGGESKGDPCEAFAHHGFNGLEREVVRQTTEWMLTKQ